MLAHDSYYLGTKFIYFMLISFVKLPVVCILWSLPEFYDNYIKADCMGYLKNENRVGTFSELLTVRFCCIRWTSRLWGVPSRVFSGSHGMLLGSRLHLGGYHGCKCTCFHNRLQFGLWDLPGSLCSRSVSTDGIKAQTRT